jgi:hypothetical protein
VVAFYYIHPKAHKVSQPLCDSLEEMILLRVQGIRYTHNGGGHCQVSKPLCDSLEEMILLRVQGKRYTHNGGGHCLRESHSG